MNPKQNKIFSCVILFLYPGKIYVSRIICNKSAVEITGNLISVWLSPTIILWLKYYFLSFDQLMYLKRLKQLEYKSKVQPEATYLCRHIKTLCQLVNNTSFSPTLFIMMEYVLTEPSHRTFDFSTHDHHIQAYEFLFCDSFMKHKLVYLSFILGWETTTTSWVHSLISEACGTETTPGENFLTGKGRIWEHIAWIAFQSEFAKIRPRRKNARFHFTRGEVPKKKYQISTRRKNA